MYFWAEDLVGNINSKPINISHIDKKEPNLEISYDKNWSNQPKEITVKATDDESGLKSLKYSCGFYDTYHEFQNTYIANKNDNWIKAYDNAGNKASEYFDANIDYLPPYTHQY